MNEIILVAREKARTLLRAQLLEEGYEVVGLETIEEAIALLCRAASRPGLIILDTAAKSLKEPGLADLQALAGDTPILVCTGPFDLAQFDFEQAGLTGLLVRPFTVQDVADKVGQVLGKGVKDGYERD